MLPHEACPKAYFKWQRLLCSLFSKFFGPKWDVAFPDLQKTPWVPRAAGREPFPALTPWRSGWEGVLSVHAGEPQGLLAWRSSLLLSHSPRAVLHFQQRILTASKAEQDECCPREVERFSVHSRTLPPLTSFVFFYHFMSLLLAFYLTERLGIASLCVNNLA